MKKISKKIMIAISGLVLALGIGIFCNTQNVYAGTFDNAQTFYNTYGSQIVFKDGYFYFATYGKQASSQVSTLSRTLRFQTVFQPSFPKTCLTECKTGLPRTARPQPGPRR